MYYIWNTKYWQDIRCLKKGPLNYVYLSFISMSLLSLCFLVAYLYLGSSFSCFLFFFYSFLVHYFLPIVYPLYSHHFSPCQFLSLTDLLYISFVFLPKKRAGLPGISTQLCITHYNKTSHKSSYQGWTRQPSRNKRVLKTDKWVRDTLLPLLGVPQENQATKT